MPKTSRLCSLGFFVLALLAESSRTATTYTICSTPCKCSKRLGKASTFYAQKFETNVGKLVKMQTDLTKLLLAATAADVATAKTALPTLAAAGKVIQDCQAAVTRQLAALKTGLPKIANASAKLAALARRQATKTTVKLTPKGGTSNYKDTSFANPPVGITSDDSCGHETGDGETDYDDNEADEKNAILEPQEYHTVTVTCRSTGTTNCNSAGQTQDDGYIQFELTSAIKEETSKPTTRWNAANTDSDVIIHGAVNVTQGTKEPTEAALKELKQAAQNTACDKKLTEYATVSASPLFRRQAIRSLLNQDADAQDFTTPPDKLTGALTAAYGAGGMDYKKKLWEAIDNLKPAITKNKERAELDIKENTPLEQLTEALARQIGEANSKASQTTKNNKNANDPSKSDAADKKEEKKDGDQKDEECKATEEGKCDKTKCDWNAEKKECKVKEGAAVISAVIKAPLLLAFLLF